MVPSFFPEKFLSLVSNFFQRKVWKGFGRNNQSIGELWIGFFRFYVEKFNFLKDVVTTRQMTRLTKFQKSWTRSSMAIEGKKCKKYIFQASKKYFVDKYIVLDIRISNIIWNLEAEKKGYG